jgi:Haem-degrading
MNIAIADAGGNLISHVRMDGAWIGSIDISIKKAYTSRAFNIATKDLAEHSQSGNQFFGIHASNDGKIMIFAGGIPLKKGFYTLFCTCYHPLGDLLDSGFGLADRGQTNGFGDFDGGVQALQST